MPKQLTILILGLAACLGAETPVHAHVKPTYAELEAMVSEDSGAAYKYLEGLLSGIMWTNVAAQQETQSKLHCIPDEQILTASKALEIARSFVSDNPNARDQPIGLVMTFAFFREFPCN